MSSGIGQRAACLAGPRVPTEAPGVRRAHTGSFSSQNQRLTRCRNLLHAVSAAVEHFESGVKEVDVKLSVRGGDRGIGAPRQKAEVYLTACLCHNCLSFSGLSQEANAVKQCDRTLFFALSQDPFCVLRSRLTRCATAP